MSETYSFIVAILALVPLQFCIEFTPPPLLNLYFQNIVGDGDKQGREVMKNMCSQKIYQ